MESWGTGPFDNDQAVALVALLLAQPAPSRVQWRLEDALSGPFRIGGRAKAWGIHGATDDPDAWPHLTTGLAARAHAAAALLVARDQPEVVEGLDRRRDLQGSVRDLVTMSVFDRDTMQRELLTHAVLGRLTSPRSNDWIEHWRRRQRLIEVLGDVDVLRSRFVGSSDEWLAGMPMPDPDVKRAPSLGPDVSTPAEPYEVLYDDAMLDWWLDAAEATSIHALVTATLEVSVAGSCYVSDAVRGVAMAVIVAGVLDGDTTAVDAEDLAVLAPLTPDPALVTLARRGLAAAGRELGGPGVWASDDDLHAARVLIEATEQRLGQEPPAA